MVRSEATGTGAATSEATGAATSEATVDIWYTLIPLDQAIHFYEQNTFIIFSIASTAESSVIHIDIFGSHISIHSFQYENPVLVIKESVNI
jgi:hypothetical protein